LAAIAAELGMTEGAVKMAASRLIHVPADAVRSTREGEAPSEPRGEARTEPRPPQEPESISEFVYEKTIRRNPPRGDRPHGGRPGRRRRRGPGQVRSPRSRNPRGFV